MLEEHTHVNQVGELDDLPVALFLRFCLHIAKEVECLCNAERIGKFEEKEVEGVSVGLFGSAHQLESVKGVAEYRTYRGVLDSAVRIARRAVFVLFWDQ